MPNMLATAGTMINSFKSSLGETVTVSDGGYSVDIKATVIGDGHVVQDSNGNLINWTGKAIHFTAADLILNGNVVKAKVGMRIERSNGEVYEVMKPGGSEREVDDLGDGLRAVMRVKLVKAP